MLTFLTCGGIEFWQWSVKRIDLNKFWSAAISCKKLKLMSFKRSERIECSLRVSITANWPTLILSNREHSVNSTTLFKPWFRAQSQVFERLFGKSDHRRTPTKCGFCIIAHINNYHIASQYRLRNYQASLIDKKSHSTWSKNSRLMKH